MKNIFKPAMIILIVILSVIIAAQVVVKQQQDCYQFEPHQKCKTIDKIINEKINSLWQKTK